MRANRKAKRYFGRYYGVSWKTKYRYADYEAYYLTHYLIFEKNEKKSCDLYLYSVIRFVML